MDNQIFCEFCGTAYDPREGVCPICQGQPEGAENYMGDHYDYDERPMEQGKPVRKHIGGKIAALFCLLLLLAGFTGYILYSFELLPFLKPTVSSGPSELIPCTQLAVNASELTLSEEGQSVTLQTFVQPANTTDRVIFSVDNPAAVSVTQDGTVVAKAPGEANITVICGGYMAYCKVTCRFDAEEPEPEPEPPARLSISDEAVVFTEKGEQVALSLTGGDGSNPVWATSDESIVTVDENGHLEAVGSGNATVTATVGAEDVSCTVRCQFE